MKTFSKVTKLTKTTLLRTSFILFVICFSSCGTNEIENVDEDEYEIEDFTTQIKGEPPPVMKFYEVNMSKGGQSFGGFTNRSFNINVEENVYWAEWTTDGNKDLEEIQFLIENTPGSIYEFQTQTDIINTYTISKVNEDGIWVMTNSNNNNKGYLCDKDAAIMYESMESDRNVDDTPEQIVADLGTQWVALSKENEEWIIFNECRYGSGGLYFEKDGSWLEFSGGGDARSKMILEMKRIDYNNISLKIGNEIGEPESDATITITDNDIIIFNMGTENESAFILESSTDLVKTVNEECDESEM